MSIRDSIEKIQAAFATLTDESLAALESSLEEELQLVRTLIAVRKILSRKLDDGETTVDADRREKAAENRGPDETVGSKADRLGQLKADLVEHLTKHGDSRREFVIEAMGLKGHEKKAVQAVFGGATTTFRKLSDGRWGLVEKQPAAQHRSAFELDDEDKDELGMR